MHYFLVYNLMLFDAIYKSRELELQFYGYLYHFCHAIFLVLPNIAEAPGSVATQFRFVKNQETWDISEKPWVKIGYKLYN